MASFGSDSIILEEFDALQQAKVRQDIKAGRVFGLSWGLSQAVINLVFGSLYLASGELYYQWPEAEVLQVEPMYIAMFCLLFGAFTAGQAMQFGPDVAKAREASLKVYSVVDRPSFIDALGAEQDRAVPVPAEGFRGEIEFRDVWFRYPTARQQWVFKGLSLKIHAGESIAIVGESGQGKSTFINLVLRFYDPEFGTVLVDGVDVRNYKIRDLRQRMGLVMQEPTLFNYSVKENILYGGPTQSNEAIVKAAGVAEARTFIESDTLAHQIEDEPGALLMHWEGAQHAEVLKKRLGAEEYRKSLDTLRALAAKAAAEGKMEEIKDLIDRRDAGQKGHVALHSGYDIQCGIRGGKLSGGQKQRVAIARAVLREPAILMLDEATSALDEESQRKVQKALEGVSQGRTSIVVAHRLTTVKACSRVAQIEDGEIVDDGAYDELVAGGGAFQRLAAGLRKREARVAAAGKEETKSGRPADNQA